MTIKKIITPLTEINYEHKYENHVDLDLLNQHFYVHIQKYCHEYI